MELSILGNTSAIVVSFTTILTLVVAFFKVVASTSIEKKLETYSQRITRHLMICLVWWLVVMIGIISRISISKLSALTKQEWGLYGFISLSIFFLVILMYGEVQNFSSVNKKDLYFIHKNRRFKFVNRIDQDTLLLKQEKKEEEVYKFLSYTDFNFDDQIWIHENFSDDVMKKALKFYSRLIRKNMTLEKIKFYTFFIMMTSGFLVALSIIYDNLLWTLFFFIIGLILGAISFKKTTTYFTYIGAIRSRIGTNRAEEEKKTAKMNKIVIFEIILLIFIGIGMVLNFNSHVVIGSSIIIFSSIVLSMCFIKQIIEQEKIFIKNHDIESNEESLKNAVEQSFM